MSVEELGAWPLRSGIVPALRVLEMCPMVPADAFGPMVGLTSRSAAYKQLARLRARGLAEKRNEDLGFLVGDRRRGLWSITELGRRALRSAGEQRDVGWRPEGNRHQWLLNRQLPLRVACYRLLAWFLIERREQGQVLAVQGWECPWVRDFQPAEGATHARVKLPAAACISSHYTPHPAISPSRWLLLLPDLGSAPVARYGEMLRRVIIHNEHVARQPRECHRLLVGAPDPDGRGTRVGAWDALLGRVARREQAESSPVHVVDWGQVGACLGLSATSALVAGRRDATLRRAVSMSGREQVLHLMGRHPLLSVRQLALLLGTTRGRIERFEREMIELGWLQAVDAGDLHGISVDLSSFEFGSLGLVEVTNTGRRRLADMLGLDVTAARRYHGLTGSGRAEMGQRRRLLRALAHTVGTNDVFVAFAVAAAQARRRGYQDELSEWRGAAACERRRCKPDGYGLYTRNGVGYGFLLEYDRGTESARKYAAKFRAYYRYRDSGQAARDYNGLPTILFVTTSRSAEDRIADQAHRAWFSRGSDPLRVLITTSDKIAAHREGILGPIWRTPGPPHGTLDADRHYLLPGGPPRSVFGREQKRVPMPALVWPAGHAWESVDARSQDGSREGRRRPSPNSREQRSTRPTDQPLGRID